MRLIGLVTALLAIVPMSAQAVTIDFDGVSERPINPGDSYVEDGFRFQTISGSDWGILEDSFGNPAPGFVIGFLDPIGIGDVFSITRVDGGQFTLDGFDYFSGQGGFDLQTDGVDIRGIRGGVVVETEVNFSTFSRTLQTFAGFSSTVDEIQLVGASIGSESLTTDNWRFTTVAIPLPASVFLMLGSLGVLAGGARLRSNSPG